jgi:hypothetical protein
MGFICDFLYYGLGLAVEFCGLSGGTLDWLTNFYLKITEKEKFSNNFPQIAKNNVLLQKIKRYGT